MSEDRRIMFRQISALVAGGLLLAAASVCAAQGGNRTTSAADKGQVTKFYFLMGPFGFAPTEFGFIPEARAFGGGPWWVPLSDCEIEPENHRNVCEAFVIVKPGPCGKPTCACSGHRPDQREGELAARSTGRGQPLMTQMGVMPATGFEMPALVTTPTTWSTFL